MGSKILNGDRSLAVEHIAKLSFRFKVRPEVFLAASDFKFAV
jgi:antitoxin component HigA of HigAB toxin-antitoxin module